MRAWISKLVNLSRRAASLFRKRLAHREIAIVGPSEDDCQSLARLLFRPGETEDDSGTSAKPLRFARAVSRQSTDSPPSTDSVKTYEGMFLPPGGRGKTRWWVTRVPAWDQQKKAPQDGDWQKDSDTFLICIPYDRISGNGLRSDDLDFHLPLTVGYARSRGRLRRAAVVVTGLPDRAGLRHASQARCDVPWKRNLASGLEEKIRTSSGRHGDGLADPAWVETLRKEIAANEELAEFFEVIRRAARRDCPLFFVPAERGGGLARLPVLEWIHGKPKQERRPTGPVLKALCGMTSIVLLAMAAVAWNMPAPISASQRRALVDGSSADLHSALEHAAGEYDRSAVLLTGFGEDRRQLSVAAIEQAIKVLEGSGFPSARWQELEIRVDDALSTVIADAPGSRPEASETLRQLLREQMALRSSWMVDAVDRGIDPAVVEVWDGALDRLMVVCLLLGLNLDGRGLGEMRIPSELVLEVDAYQDELLRADRYAASRELVELSVLDEFYERLGQEMEALALNDPVRRAASTVPRPDPGRLLDEVEALELVDVAAKRSWIMGQIDLVERLSRITICDEPLVAASTAAHADDLEQRIRAAMAPREMVIEFRRSHDRDWHLDIDVERDGRALPTSPPSDENASLFRVPSGKLGQKLVLTLNTESGTHVARPGSRCTEGRRVTVKLDRKEGSIRFGDRIVHFRVVSGFPEWSSATG